MVDSKKYTTITVPIQLADKIKDRIEDTGFNSVSSYVTYVLRQVLSNIEKENNTEKKEPFSEEDEKKVKKRLKMLGYL